MKKHTCTNICIALIFAFSHLTAFGQVWFKTYSLPTGSTINQLKAMDDVLYIASDSGLHTFNEEGIWKSYTQAGNLQLNDIKSIDISGSQVRIGLPERQVAVMNDTNWSTFQFNGSLAFSYCSRIQNLGGFWYYGTDAGQVYLLLDTLAINLVDGYSPGMITGISETTNGVFIALSSNGIYLDIDGTTFFLDENNSLLPSSNILCGIVHEDVAYDGTDNGLYVADFNVGPPPAVQIYNTSNSPLPGNRIQALCADGEAIWIGTDKGLVKWTGASNFEIYSTDNSNIPSNDVRHIEVTENNLWIATGNGRISFTQRLAGYVHSDHPDEITVYPNPATDRLHVDLPIPPSGHPYEICIVNDKGQVVKVLQGVPLQSMDVSDLTSGSYYLKGIVSDAHVTIPFIVLRRD